MNKEEQELLDSLFISDEKETVINPYSGKSVELEPQAVALYDYIKGCEALIHSGTKELNGKNLSAQMGIGLGIFMAKWPSEYFDLLD